MRALPAASEGKHKTRLKKHSKAGEVQPVIRPRPKMIPATRLAALLATVALGVTAHAADFPALYNTETDPSQPLSPAEAAAKFTLPPGFKATVFASEPDVQNPIAMTWDTRGRLWIAENYTYAEAPKKFDLAPVTVLVLEDEHAVAQREEIGRAHV